MSQSFVRYSNRVAVVSPDESDTIGRILQSMPRLSDRTRTQYRGVVRVLHAKSHGLAVGELVVLEDLPEPLRQELFVKLGRYPVAVRLANVPRELMSDAESTQTGPSIKVLAVEGEMLPRLRGHPGF
jgi:hypothetical protein